MRVYKVYSLTGEEIDKLASGEIKPEDVKTIDKEIIFTPTGIDVKIDLMTRGIPEERFEEIINTVISMADKYGITDLWLLEDYALRKLKMDNNGGD